MFPEPPQPATQAAGPKSLSKHLSSNISELVIGSVSHLSNIMLVSNTADKAIAVTLDPSKIPRSLPEPTPNQPEGPSGVEAYSNDSPPPPSEPVLTDGLPPSISDVHGHSESLRGPQATQTANPNVHPATPNPASRTSDTTLIPPPPDVVSPSINTSAPSASGTPPAQQNIEEPLVEVGSLTPSAGVAESIPQKVEKLTGRCVLQF